MTDDERPVHRPAAPDAPVPGRQWYSGCDPDRPRVGPNGTCEGCGETACTVCGREDCPDHEPDPNADLIGFRFGTADGEVEVVGTAASSPQYVECRYLTYKISRGERTLRVAAQVRRARQLVS